MNVTRVCDLAHVLVLCRHEEAHTIPIGAAPRVRYCIRCGALRDFVGTWLRPNLHDDLARVLAERG